jgi:hypothetical protein
LGPLKEGGPRGGGFWNRDPRCQLLDLGLGNPQFFLQTDGGGVLRGCPAGDLVRKRRQVVIPGGVGFGEKGHRIVETSDLGGLVDSPHVVLSGSGDNSLPDLPLEDLVGVHGSGKLRLEPVVRGLPLSFGLLVDVEGSPVKYVIRSFDVPHPMICLVELVPAGLVKLLEFPLGLLMLVYDCSYPTGGVHNFDNWLRRRGPVGNLETGGRVFETEYINVGGSYFFEKKVNFIA